MAAATVTIAHAVPHLTGRTNDKEINKVFMTLKQQFADTWQATLNATHSEVEFDSKMMYVDAYVNKADGMLLGHTVIMDLALIMSAAPVEQWQT